MNLIYLIVNFHADWSCNNSDIVINVEFSYTSPGVKWGIAIVFLANYLHQVAKSIILFQWKIFFKEICCNNAYL